MSPNSCPKILVLRRKRDRYAGEIVSAAMWRSFSEAQVETKDFDRVSCAADAVVIINPADSASLLLKNVVVSGGKALILGKVGPRVADQLGLEISSRQSPDWDWASTEVDESEPFNTSKAKVRYNEDNETGRTAILTERPLCRYDFSDEWNNMGFGRITCDGTPWSAAAVVTCAVRDRVAWIEDDRGNHITDYVSVTDFPNGSAMWFNRSVGPVDSLEWRIIERFFGEYRHDGLCCFPYLSEIPSGYIGATAPRLDCDEAVSSALPLVELYASWGVPLSIAVPTASNPSTDDLGLIRRVIAAGGAVLPHSANHFSNWGGNYESALDECRASKQWIEEYFLSGRCGGYLVSPFHENPVYAVKAMAEAGYEAFVSGIIHNDPEFLIGRAGRVPFVRQRILSLSQQCMLHGDCFHRYGDSVEVYKENFDNHIEGGAIFGYVDHPFSTRYQYGWKSEQERLAAHEELLQHMHSVDGIWWCSLNDCLDFLVKRDAAAVVLQDGKPAIIPACRAEIPFRLEAFWKGKSVVES